MGPLRIALALSLAFLPSTLKILLLRASGAQIGKGCRIGLSILDASELRIGDHVYIGHLNLFWRLRSLTLDTGSRIGHANWIAGGATGHLSVGRNSSLRRFHFLEASGSIRIEANSILAGRGIQMFTHGLHPQKFEDIRPITIGEWCYIGAFSQFVPGVELAKGTFVGMGAVVTKSQPEEYVLIGGNPARLIKALGNECLYFRQPFLRHKHHPASYRG